jgi:hypothetical protein
MALAFTVLLESGALWYDVPIHGICTAECEPRELSLLQQWDCLSDDFTVHAYEPLKTLKVVANQDSLPLGTYMFTIDFLGSFYADDPGEHKTLNVIELVTGHLVAMPNNKLLFEDKTFTKITDWPKYVRTDRHYYAEE